MSISGEGPGKQAGTAPLDLSWQVVESEMTNDVGLAVLPRTTVDHWMERIPVLVCSSWGELRAKITPEVYDEVLELAGYGTFEGYTAHLRIVGAVPLPGAEQEAAASYDPDAEPPGDDEPFSALEDLLACADGDWPPAVEFLMEMELPDALLNAYAERTVTVFNGVFAEIPPVNRDAVLAALRAAGYRLTEDPRLDELVNCRM